MYIDIYGKVVDENSIEAKRERLHIAENASSLERIDFSHLRWEPKTDHLSQQFEGKIEGFNDKKPWYHELYKGDNEAFIKFLNYCKSWKDFESLKLEQIRHLLFELKERALIIDFLPEDELCQVYIRYLEDGESNTRPLPAFESGSFQFFIKEISTTLEI